MRTELQRVADPTRAQQMQSYMKSKMPYHGVASPVLKRICRKLYADLEFSSVKEWQAQVLSLWRDAKFREERYGALALAGHKSAREFQTPTAMKIYEEMIVTGAWWDYVDDLATHRVGTIVRDFPSPMKGKMRAWSKSKNIWKRRTSILCQLGFGDETDLDLLYACIEPSMASNEFFLRKAIGWALRQVAWRDPNEIIRYVKRNRTRLSPLSKREALKNVIKSGNLREVP